MQVSVERMSRQISRMPALTGIALLWLWASTETFADSPRGARQPPLASPDLLDDRPDAQSVRDDALDEASPRAAPLAAQLNGSVQGIASNPAMAQTPPTIAPDVILPTVTAPEVSQVSEGARVVNTQAAAPSPVVLPAPLQDMTVAEAPAPGELDDMNTPVQARADQPDDSVAGMDSSHVIVTAVHTLLQQTKRFDIMV